MVNYLCNSKLQYYESDTNQLCRKAGLSPDVTIYLYDLIFNLLVLSYFSHWLLCRLLLDNVTLETSGDYRCQVTKKIYLDFEIKIDAKNKKIFKIELMWGERKIFEIWMESGRSRWSHNKVFFSGGLLQHTAAGGDSKFQREYWCCSF